MNLKSLLTICLVFPVLGQVVAQTIEVTSTGVGIGTSAPSTTLQVVGPITAGASGGSTQGVDYLYGYYGSGKLSTLGSQYSSGASFLGYAVKAKPGAIGYLSSTDVAVGRAAFEANMGFLAFWTGGSQTSTDGGTVSMSERMRIDSSGYVGIGTTTPGTYWSKLEVVDNANGNVRISVGTTATSGNSGFQFVNGTAWAGGIYRMLATNDVAMWTASDGSNPRFLIQNSSGNVGIGTTSPGYKLEVAGSVRATSFIANSNTYADFVFKPDYKLRSLSEVESSIKTQGHLPDIPSEAEAKARGIDLAQMQVKLLQKVEELTLYLVAHDKELKQLRAENAEMRRELSQR